MKLYYSPGACSLAPHIVLVETGQEFTLVKVDTARHVTTSGIDYLAINLKGQVPVLELDDGSRLSEGPIVAQYIADQAGNTLLMPAAGTLSRYRVMEWQNYITSEIHKSFTPLFHGGFDDAVNGLLANTLRKKLAFLDAHLASRSFLTGDVFTAADAYLFTVLGWPKHVGIDLSDFANLQRFIAVVADRPAVKAAMKAEGLLPASA